MVIAGEICIYTTRTSSWKSIKCLFFSPETRRPRPVRSRRGRSSPNWTKYVIGQHAAKRAVAIALRNRHAAQKLAPELAEEIAPKNILISADRRRQDRDRAAARAARAVAVHQSRGVEVTGSATWGGTSSRWCATWWSSASDMVRDERLEEVRAKASQNAETGCSTSAAAVASDPPDEDTGARRDAQQQTRERFREQLHAGRLDARSVEIDCARESLSIVRDSSAGRRSKSRHNLKTCAGSVPGQEQEAQSESPEALEYLKARKSRS